MHTDTIVALPHEYTGPGASVITLVVIVLIVVILVAMYARKGR
jgi:hypothetical protein